MPVELEFDSETIKLMLLNVRERFHINSYLDVNDLLLSLRNEN